MYGLEKVNNDSFKCLCLVGRKFENVNKRLVSDLRKCLCWSRLMLGSDESNFRNKKKVIAVISNTIASTIGHQNQQMLKKIGMEPL